MKKVILCLAVIAMFIGILLPTSAFAQAGNKFELFKDTIPVGSQWVGNAKSIRGGGYTKNSTHYVYVKPSYGASGITGLSIPIRENPKAGEYRYITFTWVKWGGGQIGMKFAEDDKYTYYAGEGDQITKGLKIEKEAPGHWMATTRDLWKDFGNFTLTGVSFLCPTARDAGFDAIILGRTPSAFEGVPGILPTQVGASIALDDSEITLDETAFEDDEAEEDSQSDGVQIDWAAQIKAGGAWMYPLYLLGVIALVVALQRIITSRGGRLAPKKLRKLVRDSLANNDIERAIAACDQYPSTLADALKFIFVHRNEGRDVVSQTAGDMAARDIRTHIARIYPLSVIASIAPLLGLLGTIVGMIQAFGLVALYGDEGGASILSDSISKALITTAAGLIIAAPSIYIYFVIKNRIMSFASKIEVEVENAINALYLKEDVTSREATSAKPVNPVKKAKNNEITD
jgi:biopolymer transport protein ExbB